MKTRTFCFYNVLLPIALPIEDVVPPPIAPADIINISIWNGNISAMTANWSVPSLPTKKASAKVASVQVNHATPLGPPNFQSIGAIGPFKIICKFDDNSIEFFIGN